MTPRERMLLPLLASGAVAAVTAAPWLLGFSASHAAVASHIAFAMTFIPVALLLTALPAAAAVIGLAGAWLAGSPWALGYGSTSVAAWAADLVAGLILVAAALRAGRRPGPVVLP